MPNETRLDGYTTTSIDLASFLRAKGYPVLDTHSIGKLVQFTFPQEASRQVECQRHGASLPVIEVFNAHKELWGRIKQIRNGETNGTTKTQ